ncbi:unnamed protein product [Auanema sp. JU1783]|nr:unnamed protein product [Auanema sp. JU1783]
MNGLLIDSDDEYMEVCTDDVSDAVVPWVKQFQTMGRNCQKTALKTLVETLGFQHIRQLRRIIEPQLQKDFLAVLPREIALLILSNLTPEDICRASLVSTTWYSLCNDDWLWRMKCDENGLFRSLVNTTPSVRVEGGWASTAFGKVTLEMEHLSGSALEDRRKERERPFGPIYSLSKYKSLFLRQCRINANWRKNPIGGSCLLRGHEEHVITCLQINGDRIVSGSDDNSLKVWSISKGKLLFTLVGHTGGVWTSQISKDGRYIMSGSTDRTVKVWSGIDGSLLYTLNGHTSTVRCMSLHGTILVSGSRDATLRVWCVVTGTCLQHLTGHQAAVRCVQFDGRRAISGAYDFNVKVWDIITGKCIHTLQGHTNRVYSLLFDSERELVVSGSLDTTIRVWDISRGACLSVLNGHTSLTSGMQLRGDILVSCNADTSVRVWDISKGACVHRLDGVNGHTSAITSLQFLDDRLVATSSDDGCVKLWDIEKGVFIRNIICLKTRNNGGCVWRLRAAENMLACAIGSRNGTEDTKLILFDFDASFA